MAISANELRIGNWVKVANICTIVDFITDIKIGVTGNLVYVPPEKVNPIPLTPEILEKAGFAPVKNGIGINAIKENEGCLISSLFTGFPLTIDIFDNRAPLHHIKYLHQLQNLYFALTGEELNIEL